MVNYRRLEETRDDFSSAMARHSGDETRVYKTVGDEKLRISLYYPRDYDPVRRYPLLVCVHGGGWASRKVFPDQAEWAGDYLGFLARRWSRCPFGIIRFSGRRFWPTPSPIFSIRAGERAWRMRARILCCPR